MTDFRSNMSPAALAAWDSLTRAYGSPLSINSAYRDPEHNKRVGGAKNSQHTHGNAFDVDVSQLSQDERIALIELARKNGFRGIGVYNNALHFDVGPDRAWGSDYTGKTLPSWAAGAVGVPTGNALTGYTSNMGTAAPQGPSDGQNAIARYQPTQLDPTAFMRPQNALALRRFT